ncbi:ATP-binding protein [Ornithinimicrobium sp. Y1694]|uniref:sensor histidine kinase n=1 Tax=Ornithinimicrobium sp. Y1694 TaxID=3418590 RepID=UPI003CFBC2E0
MRDPATVLVVGDDPTADRAVEEIQGQVGAEVRHLRDPHDPGSRMPQVAVIILLPPAGAEVDDLVATVMSRPDCEAARLLLVTDREHLDLASAVDHHRVHGLVRAPWTPGNLASYAAAELTRWQIHHAAPDDVAELGVGGETAGDGGELGALAPRSDLLRQLRLTTDEAAAELLAAVEEVLGPRPRVHLPAGVRMTDVGEDVDQIFLVVSGRVALSVTSRAGTVTLHHASTGPVVGLLALADQRRSQVTARTTTPCEIVPLTVEQLDRALVGDPRVGGALTALSIRALSARLRRTQARRVEKTELAAEKSELAANLQQALTELEQARADLIAQARMATLGELAAGIAHELNNPVAALLRACDTVLDDLPELLAVDPLAADLVRRAGGDSAPLTAAEERSARRALSSVVSDPALVRRLVAAGMTDPQEAAQLVAGRGRDALERVELAAGAGSALKALRLAGSHIAALVESLRQHARPDAPPDAGQRLALAPVSVLATVEDAIRLHGHHLAGAHLEVQADANLPTVLGDARQLVQVWSNLLTNAAEATAWHSADTEAADEQAVEAEPIGTEAIGTRARGSEPDSDSAGQARITVRIQTGSDAGAGYVRVVVEDDGPGIPPELLERVFEPRFTTKHGVVRYGLGLGLGIARTIIEAHDGTITLRSRPGRTTVDVRLPAAPDGDGHADGHAADRHAADGHDADGHAADGLETGAPAGAQDEEENS